MNIALPRTRTGHKAPYLTAFVAALSIVALVAAIGIWQARDSAESVPTTASRLAALQFTPSRPSLSLYVVGSDEQYELYLAGESTAAQERASAGIADPEGQVIILKVATLADEQNVSEVVDAWLSSGSSVRIFDVREP